MTDWIGLWLWIKPSSGISLNEGPIAHVSGGPVKADEKLIGRYFERAEQLDQRVHAGDAKAALKMADLGAVNGGTDAQLFLGKIGTLADTSEVVAEDSGYVDHRRSPRS
jgi:hypothetical protein